jgi:hypothetical protein
MKMIALVLGFGLFFSGMTAHAAVPDYASKITESLHKLGVSVVHIKNEGNPVCIGMSGFYQPALRTITICPPALKTRTEYTSTLTHETVHVIQHLGGNPYTVEKIGIKLPKSIYKVVDELDYPSVVRDVEAEAWTLQNYPSVVCDLLNNIVKKPVQIQFGVRF